MEGKLVGGLLLLIIGSFILTTVTITKISQIIKIKRYKYKLTRGRVIKSINTSSESYLESRNEEFFKNHRGARKTYDVLRNFLPTVNMDEEKHKGSTYASIIEYEVNNEKYEIVSNFSLDKKEKKGKLYKVRYNPLDPEQAFIVNDRGKTIWLILILVLIGLGVKLLFI